jgi:hypothetical protein
MTTSSYAPGMATTAPPTTAETTRAAPRRRVDLAKRAASAVARQRDRDSVKTSSPQPTESLDKLSACWRSALDAAQAALQSANQVVRSEELRERSMRIRTERVETGQLLEALARDRHLKVWLSDL